MFIPTCLNQAADIRVQAFNEECDYLVGFMYVAAPSHAFVEAAGEFLLEGPLCCLMAFSFRIKSVMWFG